VEIIIAIVIIYFVIKLIIWIVKWIITQIPFILMGLLIILGVGGAAGFLVGTFYGIKNYMESIHENISNRMLKITMMVITSLFIVIFLLYSVAVAIFLAGFFN